MLNKIKMLHKFIFNYSRQVLNSNTLKWYVIIFIVSYILKKLFRFTHKFPMIMTNSKESKNVLKSYRNLKKSLEIPFISYNSVYHTIQSNGQRISTNLVKSLFYYPKDIHQIKTNSTYVSVREYGPTKLGINEVTNKPLVLINHTIIGDQRDEFTIMLDLVKKGYHVFLYTRRGHDTEITNTSGKQHITGLPGDTRIVIDQLKSKFKECRLQLVGVSAGAINNLLQHGWYDESKVEAILNVSLVQNQRVLNQIPKSITGLLTMILRNIIWRSLPFIESEQKMNIIDTIQNKDGLGDFQEASFSMTNENKQNQEELKHMYNVHDWTDEQIANLKSKVPIFSIDSMDDPFQDFNQFFNTTAPRWFKNYKNMTYIWHKRGGHQGQCEGTIFGLSSYGAQVISIIDGLELNCNSSQEQQQ